MPAGWAVWATYDHGWMCMGIYLAVSPCRVFVEWWWRSEWREVRLGVARWLRCTS
jgi:hypothetical protein